MSIPNGVPSTPVPLAGLLTNLAKFPIAMGDMPAGWLSAYDMQVLYTLAQASEGPVLEIGSWLGRSTSAIAAGIRDGKKAPFFDTVDFGITSPGEWTELLGAPIIPYERNPLVLRSVMHPGGTTALLIDNLRRLELLQYVTSIIRGDSRSVPLRASYSFVFCDTLHNEEEIRKYAPLLRKLLSPGAILACDDILDNRLGGMIEEMVGCEPFVYTSASSKYSKVAVTVKI